MKEVDSYYGTSRSLNQDFGLCIARVESLEFFSLSPNVYVNDEVCEIRFVILDRNHIVEDRIATIEFSFDVYNRLVSNWISDFSKVPITLLHPIISKITPTPIQLHLCKFIKNLIATNRDLVSNINQYDVSVDRFYDANGNLIEDVNIEWMKWKRKVVAKFNPLEL